ncbi:MAG: acetate/propionate family kinase [Casimicrobiaceae bacterium]
MQDDALLVLNAGSSSLKFSLFGIEADTPRLALSGQVEGLYTAAHFVARDARGATVDERRWPDGTALGHEGATAHLLDYLRTALDRVRLVAAGHRVVHGGTLYDAPVRIDARVVERLTALVPLAPLHQPHNLTPIRALLAARPDLPQVACFDTAFHRSMPEVAQAFALPAAITDRGVRRYGFHGLSYEYIASVLGSYDAKAAHGRTVIAHLGNGASMCAVRGGRSLATTMGLTALDGLPMGTRSGSLDPGVLLYLMNDLGMDAVAIGRLLYQESGLLGVSGVSSDMRTLLASDDARAKLAIDLFVYRIVREIGSLAAALGGIDALVFTAGIGEHAAPVRERVLAQSAWLGFTVDPVANTRNASRISVADKRPTAWMIPTDEELMIARHTLGVIGPEAAGHQAAPVT